MHERAPPDWQLPPGVNRGLGDYTHDPGMARGCDAALAGTRLFDVDQAFVDEHCPRPGRLLDLGCGTGRLVVESARRGYTVVGVDLATPMLHVAQAKAAAAGLNVGLIRGNLVEMTFLARQSFDYAACLFSTLGMVIGESQQRRAVENTFRALRPGGCFLLHVHNRWFNVWAPLGRRWLLGDWLRSWTGRAARDRVMPVHQGVAGLTLHLFTRREAEGLLRGAGFVMREVRAVSIGATARLPWPRWFGCLRAYGYLLAAEKPQTNESG